MEQEFERLAKTVTLSKGKKVEAHVCPGFVLRSRGKLRGILYGLSGSELIHAGARAGLITASEVFADRTYQTDGSLTPRSKPDALISEPTLALKQILQMVKEGTVRSRQGKDVPIAAETICIHGDGAYAVEFAGRIREMLQSEGVSLFRAHHNKRI